MSTSDAIGLMIEFSMFVLTLLGFVIVLIDRNKDNKK